MLKNMTYVLMCLVVMFMSSLVESADSLESAQKTSHLNKYLKKNALSKKVNKNLAKLKNTGKFFDKNIKGDILKLNEKDFGLSFVIIQKSIKVIKKEQAIIKDNMELKDTPKIKAKKEEIKDSLNVLRNIEKHTDKCMQLSGKDSINKFGYIALRVYLIKELIALDDDYDKKKALSKLEEIKDKIKNNILTQRKILREMPISVSASINNVLQMVEKEIIKLNEKI